MPKMPDGNSSAESFHARNVASETPDLPPEDIVSDPDLFGDMLHFYADAETWLPPLATCFGKPLMDALTELNTIDYADQFDVKAIRHILVTLIELEDKAKEKAEDWDQ